MSPRSTPPRSGIADLLGEDAEEAACTAVKPTPEGFNRNCLIPHGVTADHLHSAMNEFVDFLTFINTQLRTRQIERLESMLMPANFSSVVGEFMISTLPKHCRTIAKNTFHNGHPDLLPAGRFPRNSLRYGTEGIEIKGSRYLKSWQGHNAEAAWLMVFCYQAGRPSDEANGIAPGPFRFLMVVGAQLEKSDWKEAPRKEGSRRTATASVLDSGYAKMMANWIYKDPRLTPTAIRDLLEDDADSESQPKAVKP